MRKPDFENARVEIDTSAPFESVKEAASRFGGVGYWRRSSLQHQNEATEFDVSEQVETLKRELIVKERETLDVLKELAATKIVIQDLNLQAQASQLVDEKDDKSLPRCTGHHNNKEPAEQDPCSNLKPRCDSILQDLQQAKLNLSRTTSDLAGIRVSVDSLSKKLEEEHASLERARDRLALNSNTVTSLAEELRLTTQKLVKVKQSGVETSRDCGLDVTKELQRLSCEIEQFKKIGETAKSEALKAISDIELTRSRIKTAEAKLIAATRMKEVARVAESVALSEIKALSSCSPGITLPNEEYTTLTSKSREDEEQTKSKVRAATCMVDEAIASKSEILKKVDQAAEEVKTSKKVLEEALGRVEAANREKLVVEEALRKWRSDNGRKRTTQHNSTKFKNSTHHHRDPYLCHLNVADNINDASTTELKPALSIGQILSMKLLVPEEVADLCQDDGIDSANGAPLGKVLSRRIGNAKSDRRENKENSYKQLSGKKKKFGFGRLSHLLVKQNKKNKSLTPDLR